MAAQPAGPEVKGIPIVADDSASSTHAGVSVAVDGNTAIVGASGQAGARGSAFVFVRNGSSWTQQAELTPSEGVAGDQFGVAVSISGDTAVVGATYSAATKGAAYVFVRSGGAWTQQTKLTAGDAAAGDFFGVSVGVSGDTILVGANGKASVQGVAYVFTRSGATWTQQTTLAAADRAAGDAFGYSAGINGDTAVVGAYGKSGGQGAAYVFFRSGGSWSQQAKLAASGLANDAQFGAAVSVSSETVVVGSNSKSFAPGSAYVFVRTGGTWTQQAKLISPSDSGSNLFASTVAISGDMILCGEPANSQLYGEAYVFVRSGSAWTPQPKLTASDGAIGDSFSSAIALSGDSAVIASSAKTFGRGAAYVFVRNGSNFSQQATLISPGATNGDQFGAAVSVDGDTAVVGANTKSLGHGAVYVFVRKGAGWSQQAELTAENGAASDYFGQSVSLSGDTLVVGAFGKSAFLGAAYVFVRSGDTWTEQARLIPSDNAPADNLGISVAVDGDTAIVAANGKNTGQGAAYVFVRSGTTWTQQAKLTASDPANQDFFGRACGVKKDTVVIAANGKGTFQGAAYVFVRSGTTWTQQAKLTASDGAVGDNLGYSLSLSEDAVVLGAYNKGGAQGAAYIFARSGTTWTQQAKFVPADGTRNVFGFGVALDGNIAAIGATGRSGRGAVDIFLRTGAAWSQALEFIAPDGFSGDGFGNAVALYKGTVLTAASAKGAQAGEAYLFPMPFVSPGGVVNAAGFLSPVAPGSLVTAFGNNFSIDDGSAAVTPYPDILNGISVLVNGAKVPMQFVNYSQVNFQMPFEIAPGSVDVAVDVNGVRSFGVKAEIVDTAPGILVYGANHALIQNEDYSLNDADHGAKPGTFVTIYGAGVGKLDNPVPAGTVTPSSPFSQAVVPATATIGGMNAEVAFAGMSPGFVGLVQYNVKVPDLPDGTYEVVIKQGGQSSNKPVMNVLR